MNGKHRWFRKKKLTDEENRVGSMVSAEMDIQGSEYTLSTGAFDTCISEDTNGKHELKSVEDGKATLREPRIAAIEYGDEGIHKINTTEGACGGMEGAKRMEGDVINEYRTPPESESPLSALKWELSSSLQSTRATCPYKTDGCFVEHFDGPETSLIEVLPGSGVVAGSAKNVLSSLQGLHGESNPGSLLASENTPLLPTQQQSFVETALWIFWEYVLPPRARAYLSTHWSLTAAMALTFLVIVVYILHRSGQSQLASTIVLSIMCGLEMIFWGRDQLGVCSGMRE